MHKNQKKKDENIQNDDQSNLQNDENNPKASKRPRNTFKTSKITLNAPTTTQKKKKKKIHP